MEIGILAHEIVSNAIDLVEEGSNSCTTYLDYYIDFYDLDPIEEDFRDLEKEIMQFDNVLQCEINTLGDLDINIVFDMERK